MEEKKKTEKKVLKVLPLPGIKIYINKSKQPLIKKN